MLVLVSNASQRVEPLLPAFTRGARTPQLVSSEEQTILWEK